MKIQTREVTCPAVPVQIEGMLAGGRFYYFRSRYMSVQLGVGDTPDEAVEATLNGGDGVFITVTNGDEDFQMGGISTLDACRLLMIMLRLYEDRL